MFFLGPHYAIFNLHLNGSCRAAALKSKIKNRQSKIRRYTPVRVGTPSGTPWKCKKPNVYWPWYGWYTCTPPGYPPCLQASPSCRAGCQASVRHSIDPNLFEAIRTRPNLSEVKYFFSPFIGRSAYVHLNRRFSLLEPLELNRTNIFFSPVASGNFTPHEERTGRAWSC
jgi:hypothetical protein